MKNRFHIIPFLLLFLFSLTPTQLAGQSLVGKSLKQSNVLQATRSYPENSILDNGKFYKISVKESGIYKISYESLKSLGVEPENVRIYGYGGALMEQDLRNDAPCDLPEVPIWVEKGSDGVFNAGDYILFYGVGVNNWKYDRAKSRFYHKLNHYANAGHYFISSDKGAGKRVEQAAAVQPGEGVQTVNIVEFTDYQVHEVEKINLGRTGQIFYGEEFASGRLSHSFSFDFPNVVPGTADVRLDMAVTYGDASKILINFNGTQEQISVPAQKLDLYRVGYPVAKDMRFTVSASKLDFSINFQPQSESQKAYLNYIEVEVRRKLIMDGSVFYFRNVDNAGTNRYNKFQISGAEDGVQVWDISDPVNVKQIPVSRNGNLLEFVDKANAVKQYVALNPSKKASFSMEPTMLDAVPNQNLHGMAAAEFTIITHPMFLAQANRLAQAHRDIDGMSVNVVTTEQVYNEFSSGTPDATAYRRAMKMWYDTGGKVPKYLLLFGRGSFDNRGIINDSGDNLVLTYQAEVSLDKVKSYVTDDYYGLLEDGKGFNIDGEILDLGIGRFPVATQKQADDVVNKMLGYMKNDDKGDWKNQIAFVADDGDGGLHMRDMENQVAKVMEKEFPAYQYNKIYLDAYKKEINARGGSYPQARTHMMSLINSGLFMLNFMGHAHEHGWTDERILTTYDLENMYNSKLPIWVAATCDFVLFDDKIISAGEYVLLNPTGGGIGLLSAARVVYASENARLNNRFVKQLFLRDDNGSYPRLGDALRVAKNNVGPGMNKLSYMLFGNPALKLNYPGEYEVVTDRINGEPISGQEVLKAQSVSSFSAYVADRNGQKQTDFNGTVEVTLLDKEQETRTLNNQDGGAITYRDRTNVIYSGKAEVINGDIHFDVMIPRDIRYNVGSGRISYYAFEKEGDREAQGYSENFLVGGAVSVEHGDTIGPEIQIYLNTQDFKPGGKVNETPLFIAHVFDENGINTVGSGIGHDLKLVIDNDPYSTYVLNEFFEADLGSYQSGVVRMKLPKLSPGKHTISFYAWDMLNNSTVVDVEFEVVEGLKPEILSVTSFPNPVQTTARFLVEHDRPEQVLNTTLNIFDLTGRMLYSKTQNSADNLSWDLTDSSGRRVQPGVYLYKVSVKTPGSKLSSKANKIIVLRQ